MRILILAAAEIGIDVLGYFTSISLAVWLLFIALKVFFAAREFCRHRHTRRHFEFTYDDKRGLSFGSFEHDQRVKENYNE